MDKSYDMVIVVSGCERNKTDAVLFHTGKRIHLTHCFIPDVYRCNVIYSWNPASTGLCSEIFFLWSRWSVISPPLSWDSYTCTIHAFVWTRLDYSTSSLSSSDRAVLQIYTVFPFSEAVRVQNIQQIAFLSKRKEKKSFMAVCVCVFFWHGSRSWWSVLCFSFWTCL